MRQQCPSFLLLRPLHFTLTAEALMSAVTTLKKDEEEFGDGEAKKGKGHDDDDSDDEDDEELFLKLRQQRNDPAVKVLAQWNLGLFRFNSSPK